MSHNQEYQSSLRSRWAAAELTDPPAPWRPVPVPHVGGIFAAGFDPEGSYLLLLSHDGRGVIDCRSGEKVARDYDDEYDWPCEQRPLAQGIGPLAGKEIRVAASFFNGGLPTITEDGWRVQVATPDWPDAIVWCEEPGGRDFYGGGVFYKLWEWDIPFAFGFSESGSTMVIACSNEVRVWVR